MKKLKQKAYCQFCPKIPNQKRTTLAVWRSNDHMQFACDSHAEIIQKREMERRDKDRDYSEADYATWLRT